MLKAVFIILFFAFAPIAYGQDPPVVTLEPGYGTSDDSFALEVTISGKSSGQLGQPQFAESEDFEIQSVGMSTRNESINGVQRYQIIFAFQITTKRELKPGTYELPLGSISIDGKDTPLNPGKLTILPQPTGSGNTGSAAKPSATGIDFTQIVDNEAPYVGEQVVYRAEIATSLPFARAALGDITFNGFWHESFGQEQQKRRMVGDTTITSISDAIFPNSAGEIRIPARGLTLDVRVPRSQPKRRWDAFDHFFAELDAFGDFQVVTRRLTAPAVTLNVQELPPPPKAASGYIPVGYLEVSANFDRKQVKLGESISLTVEIAGDANLKPFQLPALSEADAKDFTIYPDQPQIALSIVKGRVVSKKTFHIALIPQRSGRVKLPAYEIVTFNPKTKEYRIHQTGGGSADVLPSGKNESLVAKGLPPEQSADFGKQEIQILGEDLHPIHLGPESMLTAARTSPMLLAFLLSFPPLLTISAAVWNDRKRRIDADPARTRQNNALRSAQEALNRLDSGAGVEALLQIVRGYLGSRLRIPGESLTSADSEERLHAAGLPRDVAKTITELLGTLQRAVYGGPAASNSALLENLRGQIQTMFSEVERHAKR